MILADRRQTVCLLFSEFLRFSVASDLWTESNQTVYSFFLLAQYTFEAYFESVRFFNRWAVY